MKNKIQQKTNTVSAIFVLILGGFITLSLLILKYFNIIHLGFEVVFAPFVVITLLTYGDKLLVRLLISPIIFVIKLINKFIESSQSKHTKLLILRNHGFKK